MDTGAVYNPLTTVPTAGVNDHVAAVLVVPAMEALNWLDWPAVSETEEGATAIETTGTSVIVALALLVLSATLVAVRITVC
jgi:hypothetical protein